MPTSLGEFWGLKWATKQNKKVLSKSTLKEPITFQRMTSSIIVEVALLELKGLNCQFLNGGCKPIVYYAHNGKKYHTLLLNIIFICLVFLSTYKIKYFKII